jgi:biotin synthase
MALGFVGGSFFRGAVPHCLNLLLAYEGGCRANCAFCGLAKTRAASIVGDRKSFIRVDWPVVSLAEVIGALEMPRALNIKRVCVSMVTHPRARKDTIEIVERLREAGRDLSVLVTPTIINEHFLQELADLGVDKIGIALDAATPELFDRWRGRGVAGPHRWDRYWNAIETGIRVFGGDRTGVHLICGLGESERELTAIMQQVHNAGPDTHLFSFFPEAGSAMASHPQPAIGTYRRIQLARELIFLGLSSADRFEFNDAGQITSFGVPASTMDEVIDAGVAFMTQGCRDASGFITCNRPYSNNTPFQAAKGECRNFPFPPTSADIATIRGQLANYTDAWVRPLEIAEDFLLDEVATDATISPDHDVAG